MARALDIRDRSVKDNINLLVLSGAEDTNVRAAVLAELYFRIGPSCQPQQLVAKGWSSNGRVDRSMVETDSQEKLGVKVPSRSLKS